MKKERPKLWGELFIRVKSELRRLLDTNIPDPTADSDSTHLLQLISSNVSLIRSSILAPDELCGRTIHLEETYRQLSAGSLGLSDHQQAPMCWSSHPDWTITGDRDSSYLTCSHYSQENHSIQILKPQRAVHLVSTRPLQPKPKSEKLQSSLYDCPITFCFCFLLTQGDGKRARRVLFLHVKVESSSMQYVP